MKRSDAVPLLHKFDVSQILYLIGDINYSTVYLLDGQAIVTSRTLKWYSERWPQLLRVHKGSLVNPEQIHSCIVVSSEVSHLIMRDGARLLIGRRRIKTVTYQLGITLPKFSASSTYVINPEWAAFIAVQVQIA
ncbi:LytTR family transcriptional regulator [Spirosoma sp. HMF4905]|uniref:LytTR family transcriptional regulator n=1 Tax=Spirosoma arboris TaxID=2682092 RepID=A0A7K1SJ48_9BACT|nr:LytTR family DNA-binding domain-containing protein [Spirosoma arboris]MVM33837.1 LytTR family transcriptional regulator [Spirosoma arboris]